MVAVLLRTVLVEDDILAVRRLERLLRQIRVTEVVGVVHDGLAAVEVVNRLTPDLLLLDIDLPKLSGLEVLAHITHRPLVVITSAHSELRASVREFDAIAFLNKPIDLAALRKAMEDVRKRWFHQGGVKVS
jgi:DNA-binding LytR/AlgR family response regulator